MITKHFEQLSRSLEDPLNIYFLERLVEDLIKLWLALNREPDYKSAHLGVSVLVVMPVSARTQVAWDEDLKDKAATTVVTMRRQGIKEGATAAASSVQPKHEGSTQIQILLDRYVWAAVRTPQ